VCAPPASPLDRPFACGPPPAHHPARPCAWCGNRPCTRLHPPARHSSMCVHAHLRARPPACVLAHMPACQPVGLLACGHVCLPVCATAGARFSACSLASARPPAYPCVCACACVRERARSSDSVHSPDRPMVLARRARVRVRPPARPPARVRVRDRPPARPPARLPSFARAPASPPPPNACARARAPARRPLVRPTARVHIRVHVHVHTCTRAHTRWSSPSSLPASVRVCMNQMDASPP
jgi:hypothetical protein